MHRLFISSSIRKVSFRRFLLLFPSSLSFFGCLICVETQIILIRFHANIRYLHIIGFLKPSAIVYVFKIIYVPIMSTSACRSRFFSDHETCRWDGAFLCFKRIVFFETNQAGELPIILKRRNNTQIRHNQ